MAKIAVYLTDKPKKLKLSTESAKIFIWQLIYILLIFMI